MKNASLFSATTLWFALLVVAMATLVVLGFRAILRRAGVPDRARLGAGAALGIGAWLGWAAVLAATGVLRQWSAMPPRLGLIIVPPLILTVGLARSRRVGPWLDAVPASWLVAPQVFRVAVEVLLWMAFTAGRLPVQMTFEGRNVDILVGLTALPAAWLLMRSGNRAFGIGWNLAGLALLANIVIVALLSTPSPVRVFFNEPANTLIADLPFVWLPAWLVPIAYGLHVLSLRQLLRRRPSGQPADSVAISHPAAATEAV